MPSDPRAEFDRVRWRCRRGMLELDLLLQPYVEREWQTLDAPRRDMLKHLLEQPDALLLEWLQGRARPADPKLRGLVTHILEGEARCPLPKRP